MKLNGLNMELSSYSSEKLNDELVLYVEENKVISVLNQSAIVILDEIIRCFETNTDCSSLDIARIIFKYFDVTDTTVENIISDVNETIELLAKASVIKFTDKVEKNNTGEN